MDFSQMISALPPLPAIAGFFAVWLLLWLPIGAFLLLITRQRPSFPVPPEQKIPLLVSLYVFAPGILWLYAHRIADTTLTAYGWIWSQELAAGLLLGVGIGIGGVGLLSGVQLAASLSTVQLNKTSWTAGAGIALAAGCLTLFISAIEELIFRGFVVNQLQMSYSMAAVVLISSIIFALLHLVWDGAAGALNLPGLVLMGAVLVIARWASGGLGLPCGLHWGWIWGLAWLDTTGIVTQRPDAPIWLVGRSNQPLTSPLVLGLLGLTGLLIWRLG